MAINHSLYAEYPPLAQHQHHDAPEHYSRLDYETNAPDEHKDMAGVCQQFSDLLHGRISIEETHKSTDFQPRDYCLPQICDAQQSELSQHFNPTPEADKSNALSGYSFSADQQSPIPQAAYSEAPIMPDNTEQPALSAVIANASKRESALGMSLGESCQQLTTSVTTESAPAPFAATSNNAPEHINQFSHNSAPPASTSEQAQVNEDVKPEQMRSPQHYSYGDHILQNLHSSVPNNPEESIVANNNNMNMLERIDQIANRLAQRILVTDRTQNNTDEVRIQLHETFLQGAEITIRRASGNIEIYFNTRDIETVQQLLPHADDLQSYLSKRLNTPVRVEVQDMLTASSGHGQSGDERSRNRYSADEIWGNHENNQ